MRSCGSFASGVDATTPKQPANSAPHTGCKNILNPQDTGRSKNMRNITPRYTAYDHKAGKVSQQTEQIHE